MAPGKKCWGDKNCLSADGERSEQNFYGPHLSNWFKNATTLSKSITSKLRECRQCKESFKNSSADGGLSEFLGGSCPLSTPGRAIPA